MSDQPDIEEGSRDASRRRGDYRSLPALSTRTKGKGHRRGIFHSLWPSRRARLQDPIALLRLLDARQWAFFLVSLLAWTWDAFDFFTVTLTLTDIAADLSTPEDPVTTVQASLGITVALMTRSIGAVIFGLAADRYGRKWPFVVNVVLYSAIELATGFVGSFPQFLAARALFGVFMGGIFGACAATALEDAPPAARGLLSGLLQQGYAIGNLLAAGFYVAIVPNSTYSWRALMWFGAGPALLIAAWRAWLPETDTYLRKRAAVATMSTGRSVEAGASEVFIRQLRTTLRHHWPLLLYLVAMMSCFNFLSHGTQDLYPSLLRLEKGFTPGEVTETTAVASLGAILGGTLCGWLSDVLGRRATILLASFLGVCLLYPWAFADGGVLMAAAAAQQFCVQGAWGVVPIHLMELAPADLRTVVVGLAYQLGNLASSASSTIEAQLGAASPQQQRHGDGATRDGAPNEIATVMCLFVAVVYACLGLVVLFGPERRGRDLDLLGDEDDGHGGAAFKALGTGGGDMDGDDHDEDDAQETYELLSGASSGGESRGSGSRPK